MPTIPLNVILIWAGSNASIPTGWQRVTSLDGKFPKGALDGVNPNATGGSDTHTHTSPTHTHTIVNHTHSGQVGRSTNDFETHGGGVIDGASRDAHEHSYTTDSIWNGDISKAITYQAGSSLPPYHSVIFITPDTIPAQLDHEILALFGAGDIPTNWGLADGTIYNEGEGDEVTSPNLTDKFLRGATAGQDAGATGGALSHTHDVSHNHGTVGHSHQASEGAVGQSSDGSRNRTGTLGGAGAVVDRNHKHNVTLNANSETPSTYSGSAGSAENNVQPLHKLLRAIQNVSGGPSKPRGIIGLWLGDLDDIPPGWFLCNGEQGTPDMRGYHLKLTATEGNVGNTAGANTHSHAASNSHTHTAPGSHTHTGFTSPHNVYYGSNADADGASKPHSHEFIQSINAQTTSWNATTIQADASNNEPAYRTVAFIMFKYETYGGAAILGSALVN